MSATSLLLALSLLALNLINHKAEAQCPRSRFDADLDIMSTGVHEKLLNLEYTPCSCKNQCARDKYQTFKQQDKWTEDACSTECPPKNCSEHMHTDWVPIGPESFNETKCWPISVTPCTCCVRGPAYWRSLCQWAPVYNGTCGNVCELCGKICGTPMCTWLQEGYLPDCGPNSETITTIIQYWIAVTFSDQYTGACLPADVVKVMLKLNAYFLEQTCCSIELTPSEMNALTSFLTGNSGTPICPDCNCPSDLKSKYMPLKDIEATEVRLAKYKVLQWIKEKEQEKAQDLLAELTKAQTA